MSKYGGNTTVQLQRPQRSDFDLSHYRRTAMRAGDLVPMLITEAVPGDSFNGSSEALVRMAPLLAPIYDSLTYYVHFFFVPNRILWEEWETFITGGRLGAEVDPEDAPIPPNFDIGTLLSFYDIGNGSLADHLGVPDFAAVAGAGSWTGKTIDALPFLAYQRVYMDWYRDRNYVPDSRYEFPVVSGTISPQSTGAYNWTDLQVRNYRPDYFRSALPFTQRGAEVLMPLAGTGSVNYLAQSRLMYGNNVPFATGPLEAGSSPATGGSSNSRFFDSTDNEHLRVENIESVDFDASSVSISDFRTAYALQVWLERNAIAGSRYVESIQAHYGVRPQDARLQRAEFLGGGKINIKISEIVSTAYSDDGSDTIPLANLAGHGVTYGNTNTFKYFVPEHGFIIGIASIINEASYNGQGLPRMFSRRSFLDYPWPTFAKLGEQQVDKSELYASIVNMTPDADGRKPLFGYQSRYAEWKQIMSSNHSEFRSSLLFWTMTRHFASSPTLGEVFCQFDKTTQDRVFAVNDSVPNNGPNFWLFVNNSLHVRRCLPYFGQPNTLGFV